MLAKARSLCERRLSRAPDDEAAAAALAELLPEADASAGWTILRPDVMTSAAGATLTRLPDGSVLAGGPNPRRRHLHGRGHDRPVRDHRIAARGHPRPEPAAPRVRAESGQRQLPPGRDPLEHGHPGGRGSGPGPPVPGLRRLLGSKVTASTVARAAPSTPTRPPSGRSGRRWADAHWAVFQTDPTDRDRCRHAGCGWSWSAGRGPAHNALGRFRLSVTNRPVPLFRTELDEDQGRHGAERPDATRGGLLPPRRLGVGRRRPGPGRGAAGRLGPRRLPAGPGPPSPGPARRGPERLRSRPRAAEDATWPTRRPMTWPSRR